MVLLLNELRYHIHVISYFSKNKIMNTCDYFSAHKRMDALRCIPWPGTVFAFLSTQICLLENPTH